MSESLMEPGHNPPSPSVNPNAIVDQPPPTGHEGKRSIQAMVREDLVERERLGVERYGTALQAHNGRDSLVDLYQELLDACCYVRQAIEEERGNLITELRVQVGELKEDLLRNLNIVSELRKQVAARDRTISRLHDSLS